MTLLCTILILIFEGTAVSALLLPTGSWLLPFALSLPISALINVLLVFIWTVIGVPLHPLSLIGGHMVILVGALLFLKQKSFLLLEQARLPHIPLQGTKKILFIASGVLIAMNVAYSFTHAVLLPSNQYDSATNWTMRSKISFYDRAIAFDKTEDRGMAKPQYPFFFHALQITANQLLPRWSDTAANVILFALSVCTFSALFSILRMLRGKAHAILTIALLMGIPLLGMHMAQGYADLNLIQTLLLSMTCLAAWVESVHPRKQRWLTLSGIFAATAVWTKAEGLLFGLLPWVCTVAVLSTVMKVSWKDLQRPFIVTILLAVPWPLFAVLYGLSLTPHSSDTIIAFHAEGVSEAFSGLMSRGSFGITWYALLFAIPMIVFAGWKKHAAILRTEVPLLLPGFMTFFGFLFVYLWTPNVRFLLNAESYYRQMMLPAALLLLACSLCTKQETESTHV